MSYGCYPLFSKLSRDNLFGTVQAFQRVLIHPPRTRDAARCGGGFRETGPDLAWEIETSHVSIYSVRVQLQNAFDLPQISSEA